MRNEAALLIHRRERILACTAHWTHPVVRELLEGCPRRNLAVGIALGRIINVATHVTHILLHGTLLSVSGLLRLPQPMQIAILSCAYFLRLYGEEGFGLLAGRQEHTVRSAVGDELYPLDVVFLFHGVRD